MSGENARMQAMAFTPLVILFAFAIDAGNCDAAHVVWLQAEDAVRLQGSMSKGSDMGLADSGAYGDVITPAVREEMLNESYAEYEVMLPALGTLPISNRVRHVVLDRSHRNGALGGQQPVVRQQRRPG